MDQDHTLPHPYDDCNINNSTQITVNSIFDV
jgi:hypothetical protein